jgi:rhamnosyltransferase
MNIHNQNPSRSNICGLIISYHPDPSIINKILETLKQVDRVVIVDNGSDDLERQALLNASNQSDRLHLILNQNNLGQAKALNIGIKYIKELNYKWVLTLDQDSLMAVDTIDCMSVAYQECDRQDTIASICPVLANYDGISIPSDEDIQLRSFSGEKISGLYSSIKIAITSGNLINLDVFNDIGFFEEDFFIDYVDQEFCLRLFQHGYQTIQANNAILYHNIGNTTKHLFFGKSVLVANNSSIRSYYFYRNGIITYKKYFFKDFVWVCQDLVRGFIFNLAKIILFEADRKEKLNKICLGIGHGLISKSGMYVAK